MNRRQVSSHHRPEKTASLLPSALNRKWIFGLLLVLATMIAYQQTWHLGYIWDDNFHITGNPTLRDLHGLWRIWSEVAATPQYYPLVHTGFWLEYHLWGLNPVGYHLVNVFLHALAVVLLWRVLVRLQIPGAWLAAAIFAVHPVEVESVAWITERKNVLSAAFYFAAALAYLRFAAMRDAENPSRQRWYLYIASLALFVFALLSKTVACSLPAALLLAGWWKTGRLRWKDVLLLLPFFAVGLGLGLSTVWIEQHQVGAQGAAWSFTFTQRFLIAGRALWFYASKLFWPAKLTFIYPRWDISVSSGWQWLFPLAAVAVIATLWWARTRIGRGPLVAVLFFAGTLFPALGFVNIFPFRYSFVADHFQYLAGVGLIVLAAAGLTRLPRFIPAALLALLAVITWKQVGIYRDLETLWRDTLEKNPVSWMAQNNFAAVLMQTGRLDEAFAHLQKALEIDPDNVETHNNLGYVLLQMGRAEESLAYFQKALEIEPNRAAVVHYNLGHALLQRGRADEAIPHLEKALEIDPTYLPAHSDLGYALLQKGRVEESFAHLQRALEIDPDYIAAHFNLANTLLQMGRVDEAVSHLQKVLSTDPNDPEAQKNMAWVLATWPEVRIRDGAQAVELAERANQLTESRDPITGATLAAAYAETGRFPDAIRTAEAALQLAADSGNVALTELIRAQIELYRSGHPYRDNRHPTVPAGTGE
jgi:tetratricopeptide (TPR) repeat protein